MKILQVIPELDIGGAEMVCKDISVNLVRKGHNVLVVSLYSFCGSIITETLNNECVEAIYLNKQNGVDIRALLSLRRIIKEFHPDIIHTHQYALKYVALASIGVVERPIIHTVHNIAQTEASLTDQKINRFIYHSHKAIPVALSSRIQDTIIDVYSLNKEDIPIVCNGIDLSKCKPKSTYSVKESIIFICVANLSKAKNHRMLIDAFSYVQEQVSNVKLWLLGDGILRTEIKQIIKDKGLSKSITLFGKQENVFDFLNSADVFILPSTYEGMPMSIIEAMGTGLPIISTAVGGIPDMIENNVSGILISPNEKELSNAMIRLAQDECIREYIGQNAKEKAKEFSANNMTKQYEKLYEELG